MPRAGLLHVPWGLAETGRGFRSKPDPRPEVGPKEDFLGGRTPGSGGDTSPSPCSRGAGFPQFHPMGLERWNHPPC